MSRYKPTIEEISENRRQREEMSAKVESKKEIYDNLKVICNREDSTEDDYAASKPTTKPTETPSKIWLNPNTKPFDEAIAFIKKGGTIEQIKTKYQISKINEELLINQSK